MVVLVLARFIVNICVIKSFISDRKFQQSISGVMVSIAAFQAVDLGLIPGQCIFWKASKNATEALTIFSKRHCFSLTSEVYWFTFLKLSLMTNWHRLCFCILHKVCILCNCGLFVVYILLEYIILFLCSCGSGVHTQRHWDQYTWRECVLIKVIVFLHVFLFDPLIIIYPYCACVCVCRCIHVQVYILFNVSVVLFLSLLL